jgi:hypothetical protein
MSMRLSKELIVSTRPVPPAQNEGPPLRWPGKWRVLGWAALVGVMALGFLGYLMPGVRLNWETIAAMCGF